MGMMRWDGGFFWPCNNWGKAEEWLVARQRAPPCQPSVSPAQLFKTTRHPGSDAPKPSSFLSHQRAPQPCSTSRSRKKRLFSSLLVRSLYFSSLSWQFKFNSNFYLSLSPPSIPVLPFHTVDDFRPVRLARLPFSRGIHLHLRQRNPSAPTDRRHTRHLHHSLPAVPICLETARLPTDR